MNSTSYAFRNSNYTEKSKSSLVLSCLKYIPVITLTLTVFLFLWTVWILISHQRDIFVFLFLTVQVYINWTAILLMRGKFDPATLNRVQASSNHSTPVSIQKVWFCVRCKMDTFYECHHCPLCEVCIIQRDHHCFFLGTCITRQNMRHFIVFCLYSALSCLYTGSTIISDVTLPHITVYFLPVAVGYFLSGTLSFSTLCYVLLIDIIISTGFLTICFGCYQLAMVCLAKLPYSSQVERQNGLMKNFIHVFEDVYGLINFVFPVSIMFLNKTKLQINANKSV